MGRSCRCDLQPELNFSGDWEDELLDAYGIDRDDERIDYYRRLWDAT